MKTTKKVTCKAPKANTFCVVTAALFAAVILTGCPSPANGGNGGGGGGDVNPPTPGPTYSWLGGWVDGNAPTWFASGTKLMVNDDDPSDTISGEVVQAIGDAFKANATGDAMYAQITSVDGLGFKGTSGAWTYGAIPNISTGSGTVIANSFEKVKDGLDNRWANAQVTSNSSIFADLRDSGTWNTYYKIGNEYFIKFIAVSPYNGDYDIYYSTDTVTRVIDVTVVITNGTNTYVFNPNVETISNPISDTPNTTLSALLVPASISKPSPEYNSALDYAKSVLKDYLTEYDVYLVVKNATSTQSPSYNEHSTTSYRNVVKVN